MPLPQRAISGERSRHVPLGVTRAKSPQRLGTMWWQFVACRPQIPQRSAVSS
ncbi:MAG: hypothetical protein ACLTYW_00270 [Collinsella sp.]